MADTEAVELLPCPFCGGDATCSPADDSGEIVYAVACLSCEAQVTKCDEAGAIEQWNTRTPPIDVEAVARDLFDFLCRKYVQRSSERQRSMGLQYTEAETHDLAKEIARFIAAMRANEGN